MQKFYLFSHLGFMPVILSKIKILYRNRKSTMGRSFLKVSTYLPFTRAKKTVVSDYHVDTFYSFSLTLTKIVTSKQIIGTF